MQREKSHRIHPVIRQFARELRQPLTPAEATLWRKIRNRNLGYKFRRQHEIEFFIIDFYCAEVRLCIEVDGETHMGQEQMEYDAARTDYLESLGHKVIRFTNNDVRFNIQAVLQEIINTCDNLKNMKLGKRLSPHPTPLPIGEGGLE